MDTSRRICQCIVSLITVVCIMTIVDTGAPILRASSHSDAPLIKQDPQANITDVYAFVGTKYDNNSQKVLNVLVSVRPFSEPGDGVIYERFADDALYSIHITNPASGQTVDRYDFRFSSVTEGLKNPDTILSYGLGTQTGPIATIGDDQQNYTQTYSISRNDSVLATGLHVGPTNVGRNVTPAYNFPETGKAKSGATTLEELDPLTRQAIHDLPGGEAVFAGPRDDGFYADIPAIFDLLDPRIFEDKDNNPNTGFTGQDGGGTDGFQGFNVLTYAMQIPIDSLTTGTYNDATFGFPLPGEGVGVYASVSRPQTTLRSADGPPTHEGPWIQVNRMGNPLFNEAFVALKDKDKYNRTSPTTDTQFADYALNPELATLINLVFGDSTLPFPLPNTNRTDLAGIFIPDILRVNTTTDPVRLPGQSGFSRLGFLGQDRANELPPRSGGWPNGRRIGDDVVDIALTALTMYTIDLGDNVNQNDVPYNRVFPYLGTPHAGPNVDMRQCPPQEEQ